MMTNTAMNTRKSTRSSKSLHERDRLMSLGRRKGPSGSTCRSTCSTSRDGGSNPLLRHSQRSSLLWVSGQSSAHKKKGAHTHSTLFRTYDDRRVPEFTPGLTIPRALVYHMILFARHALLKLALQGRGDGRRRYMKPRHLCSLCSPRDPRHNHNTTIYPNATIRHHNVLGNGNGYPRTRKYTTNEDPRAPFNHHDPPRPENVLCFVDGSWSRGSPATRGAL